MAQLDIRLRRSICPDGLDMRFALDMLRYAQRGICNAKALMRNEIFVGEDIILPPSEVEI